MKKRGPKISCECGKCFKCQQREYQRKRRAAVPARLSERPAAESKPAAPQADVSDPEPQATDTKYAGPKGYETYLRDCGRWDARQERKAEQAQQPKTQEAQMLRTKVVAFSA